MDIHIISRGYRYKKLLFALASFMLFSACKKQPESIIPELPIENFYILEIGQFYEVDSTCVHMLRLVEIDKKFKTTIISRENQSEPYCFSNIELTDTLRSDIIKIIDKYHDDSLSYVENVTMIYDGHAYMFILQSGKEDKICLRNIPHNLPKDLNDLQKYFFNDSLLSQITTYIPNQDSIINRIGEFDLMEYSIPPQFYMYYIMNGYKVIPPVIPTHSDTIMWQKYKDIKFIPPDIIE